MVLISLWVKNIGKLRLPCLFGAQEYINAWADDFSMYLFLDFEKEEKTYVDTLSMSRNLSIVLTIFKFCTTQKIFISTWNAVFVFSKEMEGQLSKFTNLVKGWQNRWFVLDPEQGTLAYYLVSKQLMLIFVFT